MRDELIAAIEQRRVVMFTYQGQQRFVQPAAYGAGNRKGKDTLHGYQVDGGSRRGGIPHWRNFHVDQIESLAVLDDVFATNPPGFVPHPLPRTDVTLATTDVRQTVQTFTNPGGQLLDAADKGLKALGKWFKKG